MQKNISLLPIFFFFFAFSTIDPASAQHKLSAGFHAREYLQLLQISKEQTRGFYPDSIGLKKPSFTIPALKGYHMVYRSPESALFNRWALWLNTDSSIGVISIRGTVMQSASWLENFFAAMVPATGSIQINDSLTFHYKLARDKRAAVHAGWLLGTAAIAPTVIQEVRKYYALGVRQFIIFGHSQGGAIAYLLRSYLRYLPSDSLPADIRYKTYCSAAPKPGNVYYAYDFNYLTRGGYGIRVVNARDWVPQTPITVQTLEDFNEVNPFRDIRSALKSKNLFVRLYGNHLKSKLDRSTRKAAKNLRQVLGDLAYKPLRKYMPGFPRPDFDSSVNYYPAGNPVVLLPFPGYDKLYPFDGKNVFIHHGLAAYYQLTVHDYLMVPDQK